MDETMSRDAMPMTPDMGDKYRSRRHVSSLIPPPSYRTTTPTCSPPLPTLEPDDDLSCDDTPESPLARPSTPFPWTAGADRKIRRVFDSNGSVSQTWPLAANRDMPLEKDHVLPLEFKYPSRIPVATTYLAKHQESPRYVDFPSPPPLPPFAVHILAADSRIASARSGVEEKEAELERLQGQLHDINARLDTINVSSGSRTAKYRSIISRGRPLPLLLDDDEIIGECPFTFDFDYRRDSATLVPSPLRTYNRRVSRTGTQSRLSLANFGARHARSDAFGDSRRHTSRPSGVPTVNSSSGTETDETFSDYDRVSLKNFPATPRSRRSRIPRRPISSFMSTNSTFSDMPTVYETRIATPVLYKGAKEGGFGVTTVYNHHPTKVAKTTPDHIPTIGEQDEGAETCTLASEQVDQDLGTLGGYLVTPDPTPPPTESRKPKFVRQSTPMRPAQLRVVNCTPTPAMGGERASESGPSLPKFALTPAVRRQQHDSMPDRRHPAYRDDPFSSSAGPSVPRGEEVESHVESYESQSYESPRYSSLSHLSIEHNETSSPDWPLSEDRQEVLDKAGQTNSYRRVARLKKLFLHTQRSDPSTAPSSISPAQPKSAGLPNRPLRTWLRKITPRRARPDTPVDTPSEPSTALTIRRVPTARASAPPIMPRQRDSTLRFEQMLMKEIGSDLPTSRLARRASIASMQLLQRTMTDSSSSPAPSTICPPPRPLPYHLRKPTVSTFRCSMAFV